MVWTKIASIILRYRIFLLILIVGLSCLLGLKVPDLKMDYAYSGMMPKDDPVSIKLEEFRNIFGEEATIFLFGIEDDDFFRLDKFRDWRALQEDLGTIDGVESVFSISDAVSMHRSASSGKFEFLPVFPDDIGSQDELDSLVTKLKILPIYRELLYSEDSDLYFMVLNMDPLILDSKRRENVVARAEELTKAWGDKYELDIHFSGLPYIRTLLMVMIKAELIKFMYLAALVTFILLFIFFRSVRTVIPSVIVVGIGVLWAFGIMALMDFEITVLTGMIPPLIIVIGIPNCVFLLNRYHQEYKKHGNKIKALSRAIQKVGSAIFLTNLTTAVGFASFMVIDNPMISGFGIVASVDILALFVISIVLVPVIFSFLPPPAKNQTRHLEQKNIGRLLEGFVQVVLNHRKVVYIVFVVLTGLSVWGISKMKTTGYVLDDIPQDMPLCQDMHFFENHLGGVLPFEVLIDTKKPGGILRYETLKKVDEFQEKLLIYPDLSKSLSVVDGLKFARQAYFRGDESQYKLPSRQELNFILRSLDDNSENNYLLEMLMDTTRQRLRVNVRVADVGMERMFALKDSVEKDLDNFFPPEKYRAILTGSSLTFSLGTHYLVRNLFVSLGLAILLIAFFMAWMFSSSRMVLISIFPNLLPLLITAGIMGFLSISIRPSTVLIFSVAFGISVDTAIHFLAKYRQELACKNTSHNQAVVNALRGVGVSIIYTVIILFFGFGIFVASDFGGTVAMGILTAVTLLVAMLTNFLLVPSILYGLDRIGNKKSG